MIFICHLILSQYIFPTYSCERANIVSLWIVGRICIVVCAVHVLVRYNSVSFVGCLSHFSRFHDQENNKKQDNPTQTATGQHNCFSELNWNYDVCAFRTILQHANRYVTDGSTMEDMQRIFVMAFGLMICSFRLSHSHMYLLPTIFPSLFCYHICFVRAFNSARYTDHYNLLADALSRCCLCNFHMK